MYTIEDLPKLISAELETCKEYFLDVGVMTTDDYKSIRISSRKANTIEELGKVVTTSYPLQEIYTDSDIEKMSANLANQ
ncbi:hypothetical protein ROGSH02058M1_033320 [Raoultella ornithinolytica]|uniref:hypothetical protein n=1 Tax=Raoultella ornithinolytica TaxID=54291 RepID=UPI0015DC42CB|nr:hypothetical protein [Raoultella ornithinolytica]BBJ87133.1 hypothetical protein ROGSH02058M1_033320 [Raoultella ornithinolytica]BBT86073.1 hypothetical protein WP8W19C01_33140 [Raoultella ornithinolytica]